MDQRKAANERVKDRLFSALVAFAGQKDWSKLTVTELIQKSGVARASFYRNFKSVEGLVDYGIQRMALRYHEGNAGRDGDFHSREAIRYKFQFYKENAATVLAFHRAKMAVTLLDVITDCEIDAYGDMPASSISKYELYYFSGAFYNMMLCWLESGTKETPEAMADEFLRIARSAW
ncbi:TetR/AcrR family transcriptional regulator [Intestinibacillus massiliensis]|uniref:TetR/AcrR family transcriptional regulator n=1 Tax=Intestinibacillus massiliensis TaxID=1871029 RepID=UPI000B357D77|nr:TetR/AcrR family transcriptional regulator [Intestinibacillus massiliensis]